MRLILHIVWYQPCSFCARHWSCRARKKRLNYGNTPDEQVPYGQYQEAYKNFFDDAPGLHRGRT